MWIRTAPLENSARVCFFTKDTYFSMLADFMVSTHFTVAIIFGMGTPLVPGADRFPDVRVQRCCRGADACAGPYPVLSH